MPKKWKATTKDEERTTRKCIIKARRRVAAMLSVYFSANQPTKHHATKRHGIGRSRFARWQTLLRYVSRRAPQITVLSEYLRRWQNRPHAQIKAHTARENRQNAVSHHCAHIIGKKQSDIGARCPCRACISHFKL